MIWIKAVANDICVFCDHVDEVHLLIRSGFVAEALLKSEAFDMEGNYADVYRMSITKKE